MEATGTGSAFKNFWTTNEGRWGKIGLVLLAGGSLFAAYVKLLPFLSKVIWDSVHLAIGAAII
ncbi:MAG: hypothetical protein NTU97_00865, partial [Candidatus Magasanikbacteria bacterium]|nr:hypothetical protein [Candidatus Magasanikbacteria bacterium]